MRKKCGQSLSQYCISLLSGKHPRAAFSEEELELLRNLKKERADVQLMFNAGQSGKAERHRRRHQNSRFQALRHRRPARRTRKIAQAGPRSRAFSLNFTKNS